jgi:basic membrane protein A
VKDEGIGLSPLKFTKAEIPAALLKQIEALKTQVAAGTIKPPKTLAELETWKAPALPK